MGARLFPVFEKEGPSSEGFAETSAWPATLLATQATCNASTDEVLSSSPRVHMAP